MLLPHDAATRKTGEYLLRVADERRHLNLSFHDDERKHRLFEKSVSQSSACTRAVSLSLTFEWNLGVRLEIEERTRNYELIDLLWTQIEQRWKNFQQLMSSLFFHRRKL